MFVVLNQLIDKGFATLIVAVIITGAVDDKKISLELVRISYGRTVLVALLVVVRQPHVSLLVNRVVKSLVAYKRNCHGGMIKVGIPEDSIETHRAATAPAPYTYSGLVDIRPTFNDGSCCSGLVGRGKNTNLAIDALTPRTTPGCGSAPVVNVHYQISLLGKHEMPQISFLPPSIHHRLTGRLSIDIEK